MLAARERAAETARASRELREQLEDRLDAPWRAAPGPVHRRRHEVLAHGQVREHLAPLRNQTEPGLGHAVGGQPMNRAALEADRAGLRRREAHDRADRRGLAHAVAAEQGYHLSRADREAHPEQDLAHAVRGLDRIDGEHQAWSSPR